MVTIKDIADKTGELEDILSKLKPPEDKKERKESEEGSSGAGEEGESGAGSEGAEGEEGTTGEIEEAPIGESEEDKEDEKSKKGPASGDDEESDEIDDTEGAGIPKAHDSKFEDAKKAFEDEVHDKDTKPDMDKRKEDELDDVTEKFEPVKHDESADEFIEHMRTDPPPTGGYLRGELANIPNLPEVREEIATMLKRIQNISRAPSSTGRLDVRRYMQARLNHADIPVFTSRRLTTLNEGKFLILLDVSGSMWSGMGDAYTIRMPDDHEAIVTRIAVEFSIGQALQEQLTKMGATVKVFSFGEKLIEGFNGGGGQRTEEGLMWVSVYMPYVLQGYTLIFMTDADIVKGFTPEFKAMTATQHKRGGGILLWFTYGAREIPEGLKQAWGSIEAVPVYNKESVQLAIKKLMQKLLTIYT